MNTKKKARAAARNAARAASNAAARAAESALIERKNKERALNSILAFLKDEMYHNEYGAFQSNSVAYADKIAYWSGKTNTTPEGVVFVIKSMRYSVNAGFIVDYDGNDVEVSVFRDDWEQICLSELSDRPHWYAG